MNQSKEIQHSISVLQKEIDNIDKTLKNAHLVVDEREKLERERKFVQAGIFALMNLPN